MKKLFQCFVLLGMVWALSGCGRHQTSAYTQKSSTVIGSELDGSYTIRATGKAANAADAYVQAQKQAVYDVLFTLLDSQNLSQSTLKPLVLEVNAKTKYEDYFNAFFADNGPWKQYASGKEKKISSTRYSRTDTQVVCTSTVCVFRSRLKSQLIADGIVKQ